MQSLASAIRAGLLSDPQLAGQADYIGAAVQQLIASWGPALCDVNGFSLCLTWPGAQVRWCVTIAPQGGQGQSYVPITTGNIGAAP